MSAPHVGVGPKELVCTEASSPGIRRQELLNLAIDGWKCNGFSKDWTRFNPSVVILAKETSI